MTVLSLTAVALAAAILWKLFVVPPDVSGNSLPTVPADDPHTTAPDQMSNQNQDTEGPSTAADPAPNGRKTDVFTFLLVGKDTTSASTDTMILVTYDVPNGTVNCMSIPRDTIVNVSWDIKRLNSVYAAKRGSDKATQTEKGMAALKTYVGYTTGVVPDFYVFIKWKAVGELVDALDGVWFDVPYNMNYDDDAQNLHIHQSKGYRLLSGDDAMQVVRWRQNNDGTNYGDDGRIGVQQAFLKAAAKQCLQLGNVTKISEFAKIFYENVETDIRLNNLLWFAEKAAGVNMDNVQFMTMPGELNGYAYTYTYGNQSYAFPDPEGMVEMVNQYFNPYSREITAADLQIMYKNKDGSLGVTNGTLEDARAGKAPVRKPKPSTSGSSGTTATDPGTTSPGTTTIDPGTTTPGTATNPPGTATDPGTPPDPGFVEPELPPDEPELPPEQQGTLTDTELAAALDELLGGAQ